MAKVAPSDFDFAQSPLPPIRLGHTALEVFPPVLQAPMAGLTNRATRVLAEAHGCGMAVNEWVPAASLAAESPCALRKLARGTKPFAVQLFGRDPRQVQRAAALSVAQGADLVDLNMGCPGKKARSGSTGAALMREPELAADLVRAACAGAGPRVPVSVKIRAGWDDTDKNAPEFAVAMCNAGAQLVTIHGRTRQQRYDGTVDLDIIAAVKQAVQVPVIANGDVVDLDSMKRTLEHTGADGVMVGRAALGNPWIFAELAGFFIGAPKPSPPSPIDRVRMLRRHLTLHLASSDQSEPGHSVIEMRKFARWYLRTVPDAAGWRARLNRTADLAAVEQLLDDYAQTLCRNSA